MGHATHLKPVPYGLEFALGPTVQMRTNERTEVSTPIPLAKMNLFHDALEEMMLHIHWNSMMHSLNLDPNFIFELPSFRES